jgi:DNA-binding protein YbaB
MVETETERTERLFGELEDVRATTGSDDGLVEATTDHRGLLLHLALDPRVYRDLTVDELARAIVATTGTAAELAHRRGVAITSEVMPVDREPEDTDLALTPLLDEIDRLIAAPPQPYRGDPPDETLPVLGSPVDLAAYRRAVVELRARVADIEGTAESDDGLIIATTNGYGRLRDLRLDERTYRVTNSGRFAADIVATVRAAAAVAAHEFAIASAAVWSGLSGRR